MTDLEVVIIGAGQAGLSAAYWLLARGFVPHEEFVVLDASPQPGGAWQHRWASLRMRDVHGIHPLPGSEFDPDDLDRPAREVLPRYFARYEREHDLPVRRPVRVEEVREGEGERLLVVADDRSYRTRALINATGTWSRPFVPHYPGAEEFAGRQLHTADFPSAEEFAGEHVVVVGGGHSALQHLADLSEVTSTTWMTRRPPRWRDEPFDAEAGREAVARVREAVEAGRRPSSVVSVTGLTTDGPAEVARRNGALERLPMFDRITRDGVAWDDGREVRADVILWATGFRHALDHLAPLGLRGPQGGIAMDGTQVADDQRIHLIGYGPSASTIGANRAGRAAVAGIRGLLDRPGVRRQPPAPASAGSSSSSGGGGSAPVSAGAPYPRFE